MFHYTDKAAWNAIRSQLVWRFKANQPKDPDRPAGAYFTDIEPTTESLRTLHQKLRVPVVKQELLFEFLGRDGLSQLNGGGGRDKRIFYSKDDYFVSNELTKRKLYADVTVDWAKHEERI